MKRLIICAIMSLPVFLGMPAAAQSSSEYRLRPQWLHKMPRPTNSTFTYKLVSATAKSPEKAREECQATLFSEANMKNGIAVTTDYKTGEKVRQVWTNGRLSEQVEYNATTSTAAKSSEVKLHVEKIADYGVYDRYGNYRLTTLYAQSELGQAPLFDNLELTTKYGVQGLWRSAIIPGWGQFHKGANLKGGLILGGCAAFAAGIVFTENQRSDYVRKIAKTHNADLKRTYATKRDHFATGRNICIGAIAALYVYNLIDAVAAPGAERIVVHPRNGRRETYAFVPTVTADGTPCLAAAITF